MERCQVQRRGLEQHWETLSEQENGGQDEGWEIWNWIPVCSPHYRYTQCKGMTMCLLHRTLCKCHMLLNGFIKQQRKCDKLNDHHCTQGFWDMYQTECMYWCDVMVFGHVLWLQLEASLRLHASLVIGCITEFGCHSAVIAEVKHALWHVRSGGTSILCTHACP